MKTRWNLAVAATILASPLTAEQAGTPLKVFVMAAESPAAPGEPRSYRKELEEKSRTLAKELGEEEKRLEKQYGKKHDKWPADALAAYQDVVDRSNQASMAAYYYGTKPSDLEDSIGDIKNSFVGKGLAREKKHVQLVESREQADLVMELLGRRGGSKLIVGPKYLGFRVSTGKGLKPEALSAVPRGWKASDCWLWHTSKAEEPYLLFETAHTERWRDVMNNAAECVDQLVKEHETQLAAARR